MATPGRKPKPTYLRVAEGNRGHRAINPSEPKYQPMSDLTAPAHLGDYGRAEWDRLAPILAPCGLLTEAYRGTFEALCEAYNDWRTAGAAIDGAYSFTSESGYSNVRPEVTVRDRARDAYVKIGALFGLSPAESARLEVPILPPSAGEAADVDPMEAALGG
jgi:P27 family predicted phage terminase small subunit